ncbi:MAG: diguanylate cyclase [bacterium]|nr:diguanylate cyclase [bacterium]
MRVINFRLNKVNYKLAGTFLLLMLTTAVPIGLFSLTEQEKLIRSYMNKTDEAFANFIASHVIGTLRLTRVYMEKYSMQPQFLEMKIEHIQNSLQEFVNKNPLYRGAGVYDHKKNLIAKTTRFLEVQDLRALFSKSLLHLYGMSLYENLPNDSFGVNRKNHPQLRTLIYKNNSIQGVLIVQLDMSFYQKNLNDLKIFLEYTNEYSDIYILDDHRKIISKSKNSKHKIGDILPSSFLYRSGAYVKDLQEILGDNGTSAQGHDDTPPWQVVFVPKGTSSENLKNFKVTFAYYVLIFLFIAATLGFWVAGKITKPVRRLVYSTEKIALGDLDVQVSASSDDEIGELAEKFDVMRRNLRDYQNHLKKKITELQTLYQVGTIVSSELEYSILLRTILDTVIDVMAAEKGSIMIYDEKTNLLKIAMAKGLQKDVIRKTVLASGESVAGHVFQTQQPMLVLDTLKDDHFVKLKRKNITPGTMLSVPLVSKDRALGVMNISKSMPYSFNDYDLSLFHAIANICATAMDNARLYKMAITDEMTGLYVRRFFYQNANHLITKSKEPFALIMLDIDHFKNFNDTYGHQCGDNVLIQVARTIASSVRDCDIPCRLGGEEFAIICPGQNAQEAETPSNRLRDLISQTPLKLNNNDNANITVSIGIASYPTDAGDIEDLYEAADKALYHSKQNGRNLVTTYENYKVNRSKTDRNNNAELERTT